MRVDYNEGVLSGEGGLHQRTVASHGPAAPLMGSFEFPRLILRDRLHINYSIIELNSYLAGNICHRVGRH